MLLFFYLLISKTERNENNQNILANICHLQSKSEQKPPVWWCVCVGVCVGAGAGNGADIFQRQMCLRPLAGDVHRLLMSLFLIVIEGHFSEGKMENCECVVINDSLLNECPYPGIAMMENILSSSHFIWEKFYLKKNKINKIVYN